MMRSMVGMLLLGAALLVPALRTPAAPVAADWTLDFTFRDPARISIQLPGDRTPTTFWYIIYTVTNNTGQEVDFYPTFHLVTASLQVIRGGDGISPTVFDAIRARHRKQYPFLMDPMKVSGKLLQGSDNGRTSVVVFRNFDLAANRFTVYVGGLARETERLANPLFDKDKPESPSNARFLILRKTLGITYHLPGDPRSRRQAAPQRRQREWVMR
jgi:hypothetical protein